MNKYGDFEMTEEGILGPADYLDTGRAQKIIEDIGNGQDIYFYNTAHMYPNAEMAVLARLHYDCAAWRGVQSILAMNEKKEAE